MPFQVAYSPCAEDMKQSLAALTLVTQITEPSACALATRGLSTECDMKTCAIVDSRFRILHDLRDQAF